MFFCNVLFKTLLYDELIAFKYNLIIKVINSKINLNTIYIIKVKIYKIDVNNAVNFNNEIIIGCQFVMLEVFVNDDITTKIAAINPIDRQIINIVINVLLSDILNNLSK